MNEPPFKPVEFCIYCESTEFLTDEHIIPYSLNGVDVLPKSSCKSCATITSKFELICSRKMFETIRILFGFNTRKKKRRPSSLPLRFIFENREQTRMVPIENYPSPACLLPKLDYPTILSGEESRSFEDVPFQTFSPILSDHDGRLKRLWEPGLLRVEAAMDSDRKAFGQLLAKMALGMAVARYGDESFQPLVQDIILGVDDNHPYLIGNFPIGGYPEPDPASIPNKVHDIVFGLSVNPDRSKVFLVAAIEVFRGSAAIPPYCVVVGIPSPELIEQMHENRNGDWLKVAVLKPYGNLPNNKLGFKF